MPPTESIPATQLNEHPISFPPALTESYTKKEKKSIFSYAIYLVPFLLAFIMLSGIYMLTKPKSPTTQTSQTAHALPSEWKKFSSTTGGYYVNFPSRPSENSSKIEGTHPLNYTQDISQASDNVGYLVQFAYFTDGFQPDDSETTLTTEMNNTISSYTSATIQSSKIITFNGQQAIQFSAKVTSSGSTFYIEAIDFIKGTFLYTLMGTAPTPTIPNFAEFTKSFGLINNS